MWDTISGPASCILDDHVWAACVIGSIRHIYLKNLIFLLISQCLFHFLFMLFCYDVCHTDNSICKITWSVLLILPYLCIQNSTNTLRNSWKVRIYHICNMVVVSYSCWETFSIDNIMVTIWHVTVAHTPFRNFLSLFALENIPFLDHVQPRINIKKQWAFGLT